MIVDAKKNVKLGSLADIANGLRELGLAAGVENDCVIVRLQADNNNVYPTTMQVRGNDLIISCRIGTLGDIDEADFAKAAFAALACNAEILPYAFALLDTDDGIDDDDPIVLINSVPLGDFSTAELQAAMDALRRAMHTAIDMLPWK